MKQYLDLLQDILDNGIEKSDRTGTGTLSLFGRQLRFDLQKGFPMITTKKLHWKSIVHELLWFLSGDTNTKYLRDNGVRIWDEWSNASGDLGRVYGAQWRSWRGIEEVDINHPLGVKNLKHREIDQITNVVKQIKNNPDSRRLLVNAWNVGELDQMALPPCHYAFQFYVANGKLSCMLNMRSVDVFLGMPFNIASYSLLTHMIAQQCDLDVGEFIISTADTHLYLNHIEQAKSQLTREPYDPPKLIIKRKPDSIFDYKYEDFEIVEYIAHPHIKGDVAI